MEQVTGHDPNGGRHQDGFFGYHSYIKSGRMMSRRKVVHLKSPLKSFEGGIFNLGLPSFRNFLSFRIPKITRSGKVEE
jgi:hypothetical protein